MRAETRLTPTAVALARLLAGWLAVIVLLQGFAAAQALVVGARHHHRSGAAGPDHFHDASQRHHHPPHDLSVVGDGSEFAFDATHASLLIAFAALPRALADWSSDDRRHLRPARPSWTASTQPHAAPLRPPRR